MKIQAKATAGNGDNRISALKRLSKPTNNVHARLSAPTNPVVTDARQLLSSRQKPAFDARQLLSRQSSKTQSTSVTIRQNVVDFEGDDYEEEEEMPNISEQKSLLITRSSNGRLTSGLGNRPSFLAPRNTQLTEPVSFTKTIKNTTVRREDDSRTSQTSNSQSISSEQKVVISFVNDQYRKRARSPTPPSIIRRLHDSSVQTAQTSSLSRAPIRTSGNQKRLDNDDEPPTKRAASRNATTDVEQRVSTLSTKNSSKRTSTDAFGSGRVKPASATHSNANSATILITNLQPTVTEDDVIELFSEVGDIKDIKTLSRGCVQIVYAVPEQAEDAVAKYHNQILDGKLMYVSIQEPMSYSTKSSKVASSQHSKPAAAAAMTATKTNSSASSSSSKFTIDPTFMRQALFNPSNETKNAVQFQVKL
ncbi:unnamed protein product [Adineta ricciae]|uniref:RRM domain-containing protein n=1 Tax=Adineta ricciae TaxID=249248 RepID=A0A814L7K9_ADIRI|nr:unnamed protein product [Adineta ricciae]CAF1062076.1 unnamed protein product [Adineta ricciae]